MTDETGGAAAPADSAPIAEPIVDTPNPISVDNVNPDPAPVKVEVVEKKPTTAREAIEAATKKLDNEQSIEANKSEKVKAEPKAEEKPKVEEKAKEAKAEPETKAKDTAEATEKTEAKAEVKAEAKDATKSETTRHEAPSRFSSDAKAEWEKAPDSVKAETHRAFTELEKGIQEHQKRWEPLKPYEELASRHNTTIDRALDNYTKIDGELDRDIVSGLEMVARQKGYSLSDIAAHVLGQDPDQMRSQSDAKLSELEQENRQLKTNLAKFHAEAEEKQVNSINNEVAQFKANNPRFEELEPMMAKFISTGLADNLPEAYQMAETFKPSASVALTPAEPAIPSAPAPDLTAQTRKGSQSITGAPSTGSNPVNGKPPLNIRESLKRAIQQTG